MSPTHIALTALLAAFAFAPPASSQDNQVALSVSVAFAGTGHSGTLSVMLEPAEGLHVNAVPAPEFAPDTASPLTVSGTLRFTTTKNGQLDTTRPLEVDFSLPEGTPAGTYALKGTLRWFLCSDKEGWCRMDRRNISVTIAAGR
jgi:hypothetical protein